MRGTRLCALGERRVRRGALVEDLETKNGTLLLDPFRQQLRVIQIDRFRKSIIRAAFSEHAQSKRFDLGRECVHLDLGKPQSPADSLRGPDLAVGQDSEERETCGAHAPDQGEEPGNTSIAKAVSREKVT